MGEVKAHNWMRQKVVAFIWAYLQRTHRYQQKHWQERSNKAGIETFCTGDSEFPIHRLNPSTFSGNQCIYYQLIETYS